MHCIHVHATVSVLHCLSSPSSGSHALPEHRGGDTVGPGDEQQHSKGEGLEGILGGLSPEIESPSL